VSAVLVGSPSRVLALQPAGKPGERRLYAQILTALGVPKNPRSAVVELEQVAIRLMRPMDVQVLLLDEVHNILAGTFREQRIVLNTLRYISNELQISLVCFGVNEAREAISGDVQLARRFRGVSADTLVGGRRIRGPRAGHRPQPSSAESNGAFRAGDAAPTAGHQRHHLECIPPSPSACD
jgi:hypothetical protein